MLNKIFKLEDGSVILFGTRRSYPWTAAIMAGVLVMLATLNACFRLALTLALMAIIWTIEDKK